MRPEKPDKRFATKRATGHPWKIHANAAAQAKTAQVKRTRDKSKKLWECPNDCGDAACRFGECAGGDF